jgi:hypothetical protein
LPLLVGDAIDTKELIWAHSIRRQMNSAHYSILAFMPGQSIFRFDGEQLIGLTSEGRTTVRLLQLNNDDRVAERASLQE